MSYRSVFRPDLFRDQTIVVTGGGSGIGRCCAHELASLGARVAIVGRNPDRLETVRREISAEGGSVCAYVCDIRDDDGVIAAVEAILSDCGRIDGLVNNAGGQYYGAMKTFTTRGFDAVVRNNLTGGFIFMREVYNRWMAQNGGAIVNMTAAISNGLPGFAHSGAARTGMITLSETAACEWAQSGVRVNCVAPGMIASSGFDNYSDDAAAFIRDYAKNVPLQRFGNVSEVSSAIVYLLSPAAAFITGACIRIDGGGLKGGGTWKLVHHDRSAPFNGFHHASLPDLLKRA